MKSRALAARTGVAVEVGPVIPPRLASPVEPQAPLAEIGELPVVCPRYTRVAPRRTVVPMKLISWMSLAALTVSCGCFLLCPHCQSPSEVPESKSNEAPTKDDLNRGPAALLPKSLVAATDVDILEADRRNAEARTDPESKPSLLLAGVTLTALSKATEEGLRALEKQRLESAIDELARGNAVARKKILDSLSESDRRKIGSMLSKEGQLSSSLIYGSFRANLAASLRLAQYARAAKVIAWTGGIATVVYEFCHEIRETPSNDIEASGRALLPTSNDYRANSAPSNEPQK